MRKIRTFGEGGIDQVVNYFEIKIIADWFLFFNWFENGLIEDRERGGQMECSKGKELIKLRIGYDN